MVMQLSGFRKKLCLQNEMWMHGWISLVVTQEDTCFRWPCEKNQEEFGYLKPKSRGVGLLKYVEYISFTEKALKSMGEIIF